MRESSGHCWFGAGIIEQRKFSRRSEKGTYQELHVLMSKRSDLRSGSLFLDGSKPDRVVY
jgi:hypothetical protein